MGAPKQKFYGNLQLDNLGKAIQSLPAKVQESEQYGKQFKINAAQWDDDKISISVWNPETKETFKLGTLIVSQFQPEDRALISEPLAQAGAVTESTPKIKLPF